MILIEVDREVSRKLAETARQLGITRNGVLRKLLKLNNLTVPHTHKAIPNNGTKLTFHHSFKNIQDELIPHIVKILYENGGKATKTVIENEIFTLFQHEFEKPYYNEPVSRGVPRWRHHIAWAKERAKQNHGFIKSASESGRGIWELTDEGIAHFENSF